MLGIKNFNYKQHEYIIEKFYDLAKTGKVPPNNPEGHLDGWGIGWYENNEAKLYKSGNSVVEEKEIFFKTLQKIYQSNVVIIHFRKSAWGNTNSSKHSHPFKYKNFIFAHNGTILDYKKLLNYVNIENNANETSLDSETFFYLIMTCYERTKNVQYAFEKSVDLINKECDYTSLTCIFSDGIHIYSFREYTKAEDYYTLYHTEIGNSKVICSEGMNDKLRWDLLEKSKLFIF